MCGIANCTWQPDQSMLHDSPICLVETNNSGGVFHPPVCETLRESKIHADIQVVSYLETHGPKSAPRVVTSSKMACFLCNVPLRQAAKVYTKRYHGRLYPDWKLPCLAPAFHSRKSSSTDCRCKRSQRYSLARVDTLCCSSCLFLI